MHVEDRFGVWVSRGTLACRSGRRGGQWEMMVVACSMLDARLRLTRNDGGGEAAAA